MFHSDHASVSSYTYEHTHWHPCADGFSYMDAWGCSIGFKNTHNICKALQLIILVLQCNHAIWAWTMAEHEPSGKGGDDEASTILMKPWGPWLHTYTHRNTPQHINFTQSCLSYLHTSTRTWCGFFTPKLVVEILPKKVKHICMWCILHFVDHFSFCLDTDEIVNDQK